MRGTLRNPTIAALLLSSASAFGGKVKLDVTVIEDVPSTATYSWQTRGRSSVTCSGNSCSSYFIPADSGTTQVTGATLRLLLPNGRIAIARCVANMGNTVFGFIGAMTGDDHLNDPRNCGVPPSGQAIQAEFNAQTIKLSWHSPSLDGEGRKTGEIYYLMGVLEPTSSPSAETTVLQPSQSVAPRSAPAPNLTPTQAQTPHSTPSRAEATTSAPSAEPALAQNSAPIVKQRMQENHIADDNSAPVQPAPFQDGFLSQQEMLRQIKAGKASRCGIVTTPAGAEVYVDGKFAGRTPVAFVLMQHDRYRSILVKTAGYGSYETPLWPNGTDLSLNLSLEPSQRTEASAPDHAK